MAFLAWIRASVLDWLTELQVATLRRMGPRNNRASRESQSNTNGYFLASQIKEFGYPSIRQHLTSSSPRESSQLYRTINCD